MLVTMNRKIEPLTAPRVLQTALNQISASDRRLIHQTRGAMAELAHLTGLRHPTVSMWLMGEREVASHRRLPEEATELARKIRAGLDWSTKPGALIGRMRPVEDGGGPQAA